MNMEPNKDVLLAQVCRLGSNISALLVQIDQNPNSFTPEGFWEPVAFQNHMALTQAKDALDMVRNNLNDLV